MSQNPAPKPARPWRQIAEEASQEFNSERMLELMRELNQALEEQGMVPRGDVGGKKKTA
ncbi:MAG TPA: hypothetical protein VMB66_12170 [Candidatus Acidoferrales bacterium]|nr:hypothetical protein [Candidatus Acidoferrales bacterium]